MTIALYGGSFDPPHNGHLAVARIIMERHGVDKFLFMPSFRSPLKTGGSDASGADRLNMLKLAINGTCGLEITDCELRRGGVSYTVDSLQFWRRQHPEARILFIAGMDSLLSLHKWKDPLEIVSLCEFITLQRPGFDAKPTPESLHLPAETAKKLLDAVELCHTHDASSSDIRRRVAAGLSIEDLTPPDVRNYIYQKGLYKDLKGQALRDGID